MVEGASTVVEAAVSTAVVVTGKQVRILKGPVLRNGPFAFSHGKLAEYFDPNR